jgi:predicted  nucleic acid-binding Zn-ribbon protein
MLKEIEQLLVIQDRDRKIRALQAELKLAPTERKDFEEKLALVTRQLDAAKLRSKEIELERKKLENEAESKRTTIAKYNTQKFQTRKNEEFQALTHEIERLERDVRTIEDRELELMEAAEQQKQTIAGAETTAADAQAQFARQIQYLDEKIAAINSQLGDLEAERERLASKVEEDLLDTYNRLFRSKSDQAVVAFEHDVCTGCHMKLTASTSAKVRAEKQITHCEQCGRILYRQD